MRTRCFVSVVCALLITCLAASVAAQRPAPSEQDRQEILAYPLTLSKANDIIAAMAEMTKYVMSRPDVAAVMARSMKMTQPELIAQMERDPESMAIAKRHHLSAKEYVYGGPALRMALLAAQGVPSVIASPANVAFAKANLATLKPKMDEMDGGGARR